MNRSSRPPARPADFQGKAPQVGRWRVRPVPVDPGCGDRQVQTGAESDSGWARPRLQMLSASEEKEQEIAVPACTPKSPSLRLRHMLSASE